VCFVGRWESARTGGWRRVQRQRGATAGEQFSHNRHFPWVSLAAPRRRCAACCECVCRVPTNPTGDAGPLEPPPRPPLCHTHPCSVPFSPLLSARPLRRPRPALQGPPVARKTAKNVARVQDKMPDPVVLCVVRFPVKARRSRRSRFLGWFVGLSCRRALFSRPNAHPRACDTSRRSTRPTPPCLNRRRQP
jgi:hypothetical protein